MVFKCRSSGLTLTQTAGVGCDVFDRRKAALGTLHEDDRIKRPKKAPSKWSSDTSHGLKKSDFGHYSARGVKQESIRPLEVLETFREKADP
jgi:hypothetical protein